jgi:hypothetical protein
MNELELVVLKRDIPEPGLARGRSTLPPPSRPSRQSLKATVR